MKMAKYKGVLCWLNPSIIKRPHLARMSSHFIYDLINILYTSKVKCEEMIANEITIKNKQQARFRRLT